MSRSARTAPDRSAAEHRARRCGTRTWAVALAPFRTVMERTDGPPRNTAPGGAWPAEPRPTAPRGRSFIGRGAGPHSGPFKPGRARAWPRPCVARAHVRPANPKLLQVR
jgi:hypothetical protein